MSGTPTVNGRALSLIADYLRINYVCVFILKYKEIKCFIYLGVLCYFIKDDRPSQTAN